jgi:hypothetical protein
MGNKDKTFAFMKYVTQKFCLLQQIKNEREIGSKTFEKT